MNIATAEKKPYRGCNRLERPVHVIAYLSRLMRILDRKPLYSTVRRKEA